MIYIARKQSSAIQYKLNFVEKAINVFSYNIVIIDSKIILMG